MCDHPGSRCDTAEQRTVQSTFQMQSQLLKLKRYRGTAFSIKALQKGSGVSSTTECMMQRLTNLLPFGPYVVQAVDYLHSFSMGICKKMIMMVDAFVLSVFVPSVNLRTKDDARNRVDSRLGSMPPYRDLATFHTGYWESADTTSTTGAESLALASQYPIVLVEDAQLIPNKHDRKRILELIWRVVSIGRELRTPQYDRTICLLNSMTLIVVCLP